MNHSQKNLCLFILLICFLLYLAFTTLSTLPNISTLQNKSENFQYYFVFCIYITNFFIIQNILHLRFNITVSFSYCNKNHTNFQKVFYIYFSNSYNNKKLPCYIFISTLFHISQNTLCSYYKALFIPNIIVLTMYMLLWYNKYLAFLFIIMPIT